MITAVEHARVLLDNVAAMIRQPDLVDDAMADLFRGLREIRCSLPLDAWREFSASCRAHELSRIVHQDPFTHRAFLKPRGYAGDAVMLDFIYRHNSVQAQVDAASGTGRQIFQFTGAAPAAHAVRFRRAYLGQMIDRVADEVAMPQILSVACGHLREAEDSRAVGDGRIGRLVALDCDRASLDMIHERFGSRGVECVLGDIRGLITGKIRLNTFDLVYAAGLYDYLPQSMATRLTRVLFDMLRPRGRLLIANFLPDIPDAGYMETYMDWKLIYRDVGQLRAVAAEIDPEQIADERTFTDEQNNIVFLELRKTD